jgi:hypothetical protein
MATCSQFFPIVFLLGAENFPVMICSLLAAKVLQKWHVAGHFAWSRTIESQQFPANFPVSRELDCPMG